MTNAWMPLTAGSLLAAANVPYLAAATRFFFRSESLPREIGGAPIWAPVGFVIWLPFFLPLLIGAVSAFMRRAWGLVTACAILPLAFSFLLEPWMETSLAEALFFATPLTYVLCQVLAFVTYLLMIAAVVLVLLSRNTAFVGRQSAAEFLYGPPKRWRSDDKWNLS